MFVTDDERRMLMRILLILSIVLIGGSLIAHSTAAQFATATPDVIATVIPTEAAFIPTDAPVTIEPTIAPEATEAPPAVVTPAPSDSVAVDIVNALYDRLSATSVILALGVIAAIVTVALVALRLVYNSVPAGLRDRLEIETVSAARKLLELAERQAATTPTKIDDELIAKLAAMLEKRIDDRLGGYNG
jgi:hypothetical protein